MRDRSELVRRLRGGRLSKAVRWYDPGVLVHCGIRDLISSAFGEYADQRLMQAATDRVSRDDLVLRYDYSDKNVSDPTKRVPLDENGACWVDYIADVGDGFGPTFGMATLLAAERLKLANHGEQLPAGQILIFGGDQCYPQATHEEYIERFVLPYASAFPNDGPDANERKLFAIPGNHDWYDGLAAFDSLFCQNRDHLLDRRHGRPIGGWRCQQHRSYWAIHLPNNWWLWGVDIQFSKYLDTAQENYFRAIVDRCNVDQNHNIVLCVAEPHWLNAEFEGVDAVDSLHTIARIAQRKHARVSAVLAGDWHHYSHYVLDDVEDPSQPQSKVELDLHLITAGGGGAFLHSTTDLRKQVNMVWGLRSELPAEEPPHSVTAGATPEQAGPSQAKKRSRRRTRRYRGTARMVACYPSRLRSALLSLRNLAFPLRNWRFSLVIGALYWIMTWQFHVVAKTSIPDLNKKINAAELEGLNAASNELLAYLPSVATENVFYCVMLFGLWAGLVWYVPVSEKRKPFFKFAVRAIVGTVHALAHLKAMLFLFLLCMAFNNEIGVSRVGAFYPLEVIPLGAIVGGFIFGAYWVITGLVARMHTGDAFGALGIRNHKNFLRMKFDKDKLTIYPIGVKKLPGTKTFKLGKSDPPEGEPLLKVGPLEPILIGDQPIIISRKARKADKTSPQSATPAKAA